jgi:hypothetical protein
MSEKGLNIERVRAVLAECNMNELRIIRSMINGKLGKRSITPEQHRAMMEAKRKKREAM